MPYFESLALHWLLTIDITQVTVKYKTWRKIHQSPFFNKQRSHTLWFLVRNYEKNKFSKTYRSQWKRETNPTGTRSSKKTASSASSYCSQQNVAPHKAGTATLKQLTCCSWNQKGLVKESSNQSNLSTKWRKHKHSNPWPPKYRCDTLPTELWSHTLGARPIYWVHISREEWNVWSIYEIIHIFELRLWIKVKNDHCSKFPI